MKKGVVSGDQILMTGRLLIFVILALIIAFIFTMSVVREVKTNRVYSDVVNARILYGPSCVAYNDGLRTNPGILDLEKLTGSIINECFKYLNKELYGFGVSLVGENNQLIREIILNEDVYDNKQLCDISKSKFECNSFEEYVLYKDGNDFKDGILKIQVVNVNE